MNRFKKLSTYSIIKEMSTYSIPSKKKSLMMLETGVSKFNLNSRQMSETIEAPPKKACCSHFGQALYFICENFSDKIKGDLLTGTNPISPRILPTITADNIVKKQTIVNNISDEEKKEAVLTDPRFGMFSLFKYHLNKGYLNKKLKKGNVYCFNIFSLFFALPILIFIAQWIMYLALIIHERKKFNGDICPGDAPIEQKVMMVGISIIYFVRSFFIWDSFTNRTRLQKMNPGGSISVIFDTYQEFGFNLIVYCANLWIVFVDPDLLNMIMNSLAMEFLMNLDNEFEEIYFKFLPESAIDIYDNIFVTSEENNKLVKDKKEKYCCFKCLSCTVYLPFKLLVLMLFLFPVFCLFMIFYGPLCK
jgi:hypothetical protein